MFRFDEDRFYAMPPFFGGSPVRRKIPPMDCRGVYLKEESEAGSLEKLLPEGFELQKPQLIFTAECCAGPSWLEGRDISLASAGVPVRYTGNDEGLSGTLLLAVWADDVSTVISLREETGTPAMYADISLVKDEAGRYSVCIGGEKPFLCVDFSGAEKLGPDDLQAANAAFPGRSFCWRYIPNVGGPGAALSQAVLSPYRRTVLEGCSGTGRLAWQRENFRSFGMQQNVLSALAGLGSEERASGFACRGSLHVMPELARPLP